MFSIFKKNLSLEDISSLALKFATELSSEFEPENINISSFIELEIYIYLYTVVDYRLNANGFSENCRRKVLNLFDETTRSIMWGNSKYNEIFIAKMFDDRLTNYYNILKLSKTDKDFSVLIEYQTQLICSILKNSEISFYDPLPKTPSEHSPIILGLIFTTKVKNILMTYYGLYLQSFIKKIDFLKLS